MTAGHHALWLTSAITMVLVSASVIGSLLKHRLARGAPHAGVDNLRARVRSWWVMAAVVGGALWAGALVTCLLFAIIAVTALHEFLAAPCASRTRAWINGLGICVFCMAFIPALLTLEIPDYQDRNVLLLAFLIVVAQASDVLQYVWGKLCGKHLIAPAVSPSKTVEGFAGGITCATLIGASLWWMTPFSPLQATLLSLLITLLGFIGGLILSAQKRARGIKDWGDLIHGHGGMLDRIDSLWLPAPVFYAVVKYSWAV